MYTLELSVLCMVVERC